MVILVNQMGFGSIIPVTALYAQSFGVSQSAIGLSIAIYGFARFLVTVPTGQLADRMGRRSTLVLGEVVTALGNLLCGLAATFDQFLLFRFLAGIGAAMVTTSGQVVLADISTRANRGRTMAFYQGAFLFAVGVGPLPGGLLAEWFGLRVPFYFFAALGVLAGAVAFDKLPETRELREKRETTPVPRGAPRNLSYSGQLRMLLSNVGFMMAGLVTFTQFFSRTGAVFAVVPLIAITKMEVSADRLAVAISVVALSNMAMVPLSGILVDRLGRKPVIVPSTLLAGVSMAAFALSPDYLWLMASSVLWGVAGGIGGPSPAAYAADVAPPGMNAVTMSCYRAIADLGYVLGPLLLGWLADVLSGEAALWATAALFLVSGLLFALLAPETAVRRQQDWPAPARSR